MLETNRRPPYVYVRKFGVYDSVYVHVNTYKVFAQKHFGHYKKGIPQRSELSIAAEKLTRPQHVESC